MEILLSTAMELFAIRELARAIILNVLLYCPAADLRAPTTLIPRGAKMDGLGSILSAFGPGLLPAFLSSGIDHVLKGKSSHFKGDCSS